ncbi:uncharacterized protein MONOS_4290 [Monocercomonoides exilis]|uniref:uncharacterized protein n=1 Tax=Monocercomonoides exilis TaxID=2049356 RepID=UPI00355A02FE|nr:hypothetical protein MONOS_4290 [Monocercomonoides exilis]|eukprot:MONOS_4290.1-p1 / transcript=MONOS_4290.1 / gene=MONOS_4290 / organism=Monocercomonoides_exilis_PA203 / gene_product=unspecified product / transcript_product=unspecified product / location=Mono_scaffold00112:67983-68661(+) / protein_length=203 / sequence_SO=supercontig / SO=protein_coding / is_pseudo=false
MDESSLRVPSNSKLSVVHPENENPGFRKDQPKITNSPLVAVVAADGFALPSVILWPSKSLPDEMKPLPSQILDIWPNRSESTCYWKTLAACFSSTHTFLEQIQQSGENFKKKIPKFSPSFLTAHILPSLLTEESSLFFKTELQTKYDPPSSSTSSSKRTALVDVLPQAIHSALSPAVIKKAFATSGVLHTESGPIPMKPSET